MIYIFSIASILAITTIGLLFIRPSDRIQRFLAFLGMVTLTLAATFSAGLPVLAAHTTIPVLNSPVLDNSAQSLNNQKTFRFEEDLSVSPLGDQCNGLCVAEEFTGFQSDTDLLQAIQESLNHEGDLAVSVDNGAVFLAGSVKDEAIVRNLVHQIETIPGVQWITVDLALTNPVA